MRIAIPYLNEEIYGHFGHTEEFIVYEVEDNKIINQNLIKPTMGGHSALALFLKKNRIDVVICGGIGSGAKNALKDAGIKLYAGASGNVLANALAFINGTLKYDENAICSHHDSECSHDCGTTLKLKKNVL